MGLLIEWYVQLIVYLISFGMSSSILYTLDWKKIISPRFQNDNWPIIVYFFFSVITAFLIGTFGIVIVEIGMRASS